MSTPKIVSSLDTEEEKERLGSWLAEIAPKDIGADKAGFEKTKTLVAEIIDQYPAASRKDIYYCLDNWWILRCEPGLPGDTLKRLVQEAFDAAILDRRHKPSDFRVRLRLERAAKKRRIEMKKNNVERLNRVADALGCGIRYARMLISEGTTDRAKAETLARILGTKPEDHLRSRRRTGREVDLVSWFMKVRVPNGCFCDFVEEDPKLPMSAYELVKSIRETRACSREELAEVTSLEALLNCCRSVRQDSPAVGAATQVWYAYRVWKIEVVAQHAARTARVEQRRVTNGMQSG